MRLENLYSRFSSWHRNDTRTVGKLLKADYTLPNNINRTTEIGDLTGTSDYSVQLLRVKTLSGNNKRLRSRNCYSFNDALIPTDDGSADTGGEKADDDVDSAAQYRFNTGKVFTGIDTNSKSNQNIKYIYFEGALRAASTGDVFYLERCIDVLGVPIDAETEKGVTMLQCSLVNDHVGCVKFLLRRGADIFKTTAKGRSALHTAARYNALRSLKLLLSFFSTEQKRVSHVNGVGCLYSFFFLRDNYGDTPLHLACRQSNEHCVKVLLKAMAAKLGWRVVENALLSCNAFGQNPLHVACLWRCYRVVRFFITADFENSFKRARYSLSGRKCLKGIRQSMIRTLLCILHTGTVLHELATTHCAVLDECISGFNERRFVYSPSTTAVATCFDEKSIDVGKCAKCEEVLQKIVDLLLTKCPELVRCHNINGLTPLMVAVINDAVGIVRALLKRNIDVEEEDAKCRTALHYAASRGISRQVAVLLAHGAVASHRDIQGATPLHFAAIRSYTSSVRLLYRSNSLIDVRTPNGHSAFMWACMQGACDSLRAMLEVNPMLDRYEKDKNGSTALHLAASHNQYDVVKLLVDFGWYIEARNYKEETPLLSAAAEGCTYGVRSLIDCNADVYAVDEKGNSIFHLVATSDVHMECLRELLLLVPDTRWINSRNLCGDTPLFCSIKSGASRCVRELLKHGANIHMRNSRGWNSLMLALERGSESMVYNILKYFPDVNCYSAMDGCSALTLAIDRGSAEVIGRLKCLGAKLPYEIVDEAARRIQIWFRKHMYATNRSAHRSDNGSEFASNGSMFESSVVLANKFATRQSG